MNRQQPWLRGWLLAAILLGQIVIAQKAAAQVKDITQPGDPIIASSSNSPGSEGVANAIDGKPTKYLNFDSRTGGKPSGFVVSPSIGKTVVTGISLQSANDAPERDPKIITIEGSNDDAVTSFTEGKWEQIVRMDNIPSWTEKFGTDHRFKTQSFSFKNYKGYKHYRFTVVETQTVNGCCFQIAEVELLGVAAPKDVTQPGDPIIASSSNSPGSEGVANAIDGKPTKYLNFDTRTGGKPSGFVVSPSIGKTVVSGVTFQSANDAPERDPKIVTIEGSNDDAVTSFAEGKWEQIVRIDNIPSWTETFGATHRFKTQEFAFPNVKPYKHYRFTVVETQTVNGCCFQIAEVELLGTSAPKDVTQPGDPIIASSSNSPGSEGVANAIDGKPTKYLNFDTRTGGKASGFVVTPSIGATTITGVSMQSANDAPERDPKIITIEGSNDDSVTAFGTGNWESIARVENIPSWTETFGATHRFKTQEVFFENFNSYKHYRFTVVETQTINGCCFQIAEVELLAVTQQVDCSKARFVVQPVDTLVLNGAQATFFAELNGPWPVQWFKNGNPIPGATATTYTTEPVTAANAADVYAVQIVGCELSNPVKATIFTPSNVKSIGVSFRGSGANGAPTLMNTNDIAGLHPQAYWNNAIGGNGLLGGDPNNEIPPVDSSNQPTTVSFEWTSSGEWGAGTGTASATQRMLNGLVHASPGAPGTLTFGGVPAGNHTVIIYTVGIPLQFQNANYTVNGRTAYTRVINADEYNAAPGFFRGTGTSDATRTLSSFVRFDGVQAEGGVITITWDTITTGFDRGAPINAVQLVLNGPDPGPAPTISQSPAPTVAEAGGRVNLSVKAEGQNLTYQWLKNGRYLTDGGNIGGATTANLSISNFASADEGVYSVAVFNPAGSALSKNASVRASKFEIGEALVAHLKFDETSGTTVANSATGGVAGKVEGPASWGAGKIANALNFDGAATYVKVDNYTKAQRQLSGSAWVNVGAGTSTDVSFVRNAEGALGLGAGVGPGTPAGQFDFGLVLNANDGGIRLSAAIGAGPNIARAVAADTFPLGSWQHVAFSADGAQLRLYLNGREVASTDYGAAINTPDIAYLSIGARLSKDAETGVLGLDLNAPNLLSGGLDDLALWARGLTSDEVSKIYAAGNAGQNVSTVKPEKPAANPTLGIASSATGVVLTWTGGRLQSATSVTGPWTDVTGTSPSTQPTSGSARFFRVISP